MQEYKFKLMTCSFRIYFTLDKINNRYYNILYIFRILGRPNISVQFKNNRYLERISSKFPLLVHHNPSPRTPHTLLHYYCDSYVLIVVICYLFIFFTA